MPADKLYPEKFRNVKEVLVVQDPINVFPALIAKLLIGPKFSCLFIFILEFLQPQLYTVNASFIKTFKDWLFL